MQRNGLLQGLCGLTVVTYLLWQVNWVEAGQGKAQGEIGRLDQWATVEAHDKDVPVYAFGYSYVYGVSPDFLPGVVLQEGNDAPVRKIQPKRSWEIKDNLFGSTPGREPRTAANDDQPLLGIHLIDGDVRSCWASRGQPQGDYEPAWVRIDLPVEALVGRVVLVGHPEGLPKEIPPGYLKAGYMRVGQAFPRKLEIRTSRDAWHWDTVYKTDSYTPENIKGRNVIEFDPRVAKQIWIIGSDLPYQYWYFKHGFSIAEVEVLDQDSKNLALVSRGAGVQVSSTHTGFGMDRFTQDMLWPVQYDLGFKWTRVGYDMSLLQWAYVEREKGKLKVDERTDAALTEAVKNGLQVVLVLDKGNWLYAPTPRLLDPTRDLMETYSNNPGTVADWQKILLEYPPQLEGYLNYVRYMVRHFKDRVKIFEVWNEWGPCSYGEVKQNYARVLRAAIKVIREEDPEAKIMPSSPSSGCLERDDFGWFRALGDEGLLKQVDAIGFHPFYGVSPVHPRLVSFPQTFARFKKLMEGYGFKGQYMATEWNYFDPYPSEDFPAYSEIQKAVYGSRLSITFAALGITNFWNETFQTMLMHYPVGLLRNGFSNEVISPTQPEAVYYMLRTLSTVLEAAKGADLPVTFADKRREVTAYGFARANGEKLVAFWLPGVMRDLGADWEKAGVLPTDVIIKGVKGEGATIIDVLNGTEQPLRVERTADGVVVRKVHVQDWPLVIRLPN